LKFSRNFDITIVMDYTTQEQSGSGIGSELERYILNHAVLKPGDKLEGKVIQVKANGNLLVDFKRFRAVAETRFSMKEGDIIRVVVVSKRPKLKLRIEAPAGDGSLEVGLKKDFALDKLDIEV